MGRPGVSGEMTASDWSQQHWTSILGLSRLVIQTLKFQRHLQQSTFAQMHKPVVLLLLLTSTGTSRRR